MEYGIWSRNPCKPTWEMWKCMWYEGVWVIWGMGYKGVYCTLFMSDWWCLQRDRDLFCSAPALRVSRLPEVRICLIHATRQSNWVCWLSALGFLTPIFHWHKLKHCSWTKGCLTQEFTASSEEALNFRERYNEYRSSCIPSWFASPLHVRQTWIVQNHPSKHADS